MRKHLNPNSIQIYIIHLLIFIPIYIILVENFYSIKESKKERKKKEKEKEKEKEVIKIEVSG